MGKTETLIGKTGGLFKPVDIKGENIPKDEANYERHKKT